ncbi:unnamed protein product [Closterium sp. Naga37s-1]|nr:unnamed protein product [Closterium sp. Naga37s-1]
MSPTYCSVCSSLPLIPSFLSLPFLRHCFCHTSDQSQNSLPTSPSLPTTAMPTHPSIARFHQPLPPSLDSHTPCIVSCAEEVQGVKVHASVRNSDVDWHCSPSCAKVAAELKGVEGKRGEIPDGTPFSMQLAQYNENHRGSRQSIAAALKVRLSLPSLPLPPSSSPIPNCSFRLPSAIPCFPPARVPSPLSTATNSLQSHGSMSCLRSSPHLVHQLVRRARPPASPPAPAALLPSPLLPPPAALLPAACFSLLLPPGVGWRGG